MVLLVVSRASYNSASYTTVIAPVFRLGIYTITLCVSIRLSFWHGFTINVTHIVIAIGWNDVLCLYTDWLMEHEVTVVTIHITSNLSVLELTTSCCAIRFGINRGGA